ncbi:MAG: carboxymuconolactone decarboxylase family protein [Xenophilus sp.]
MRIDPVVPGSRPDLADIERRLQAERGGVSTLYQVLLHSPPIAHGWEQLLTAVRNRSSLPPGLRELIILRVAVLNRAPYEFDAHVPHALRAGVPPGTVDMLRAATPAAELPLAPAERAALEYADCMTRDVQVPDALFARVRAHYRERQLVDLTATVAAYNMVSRFLEALRIGHR